MCPSTRTTTESEFSGHEPEFNQTANIDPWSRFDEVVRRFEAPGSLRKCGIKHPRSFCVRRPDRQCEFVSGRNIDTTLKCKRLRIYKVELIKS